jgi:hypothetical protein
MVRARQQVTQQAASLHSSSDEPKAVALLPHKFVFNFADAVASAGYKPDRCLFDPKPSRRRSRTLSKHFAMRYPCSAFFARTENDAGMRGW